MYPTFKDENAEKMRDLAKSISEPTERFASTGSDLSKAGPIASQFFQQPEVNIQHLSDEELIESMAGAENAAIWRFRLQMKAAYPGNPEMWNVPPPVPAEREWSGGAWWVPPAKAGSSGTLSKSQTDATVTEMYRRAAKKGMNLEGLGDEIKESLREMVKTGKVKLTEAPGRLSISLV